MAILPALAMGATAASAAIGAGSSIAGGIQAQKAGQIQAQQAQQESRAVLERAGVQESNIETNAGRLIAHSAAEGGAAGITAPSTMPVLSEDYTRAKLESAYARFGGQSASSEDIYAGRLAKYQGSQALWAGLFGGAKNILGGASNIGRIGIGAYGWGTGDPASASAGGGFRVAPIPPITNPFALGPAF